MFIHITDSDYSPIPGADRYPLEFLEPANDPGEEPVEELAE